ncbi:TetR/AcrR family transcriptional regulator [Pseudomonas aeruginosa]|nr:TetR/AcrR family transcriptional regulator [Pseudomonas aeruginosa]TWY05411.1 TetR/AcrR family transcriptional regulator [Pseudomonas aeruginosa]
MLTSRHHEAATRCSGRRWPHERNSGALRIALYSAMRYYANMTEQTAQSASRSIPAKRKVLAAAREAFLRNGFGGTSMDELALAANVARRTLYNQFGSKENLFRAVVTDIWGRIDPGELIEEAAAGKGPQEGLQAIGLALASHWASPTVIAFLRLAILEGERFPELPRSFYKYGKEPIVLAVSAYLERMVRENALHLEDSFIATQQFIGMINEPLLWMRLIDTEGNVDAERRADIVNRAVRLFFAGYGVKV